MLYKIMPSLTPVDAKKSAADSAAPPKQGRKRRRAAVFDAEGNEVLITMTCLKCRQMRPLSMFGLRKMADGAIRNQPWCRGCRAAVKKKKPEEVEQVVEVPVLEASFVQPSARTKPLSPLEELMAGPSRI